MNERNQDLLEDPYVKLVRENHPQSIVARLAEEVARYREREGEHFLLYTPGEDELKFPIAEWTLTGGGKVIVDLSKIAQVADKLK
jgi:hypothetical protein